LTRRAKPRGTLIRWLSSLNKVLLQEKAAAGRAAAERTE
jgi:hypothetical protein